MSKIFRIIKSDFRRIGTNVVAIVIIMGLTIIPALYAWFNILSNWDPYGPDATSKMNVAVFSEDTGISLGDFELNVGEKVVEKLKTNDSIGFVFTETKEEAINGVKSGSYYAAIIIPEEFTGGFISFIGGNPKNPCIEYYENSKKNAIATKITSKVKTTVQREVNKTFISTLTEKLASTGGVATTILSKDTLSLTASGLAGVQLSLTSAVNMLETLAVLTDSTSRLLVSLEELMPGVSNLLENGANAVGNIQGEVNNVNTSINSISVMIDINFDAVIEGLDNVKTELSSLSIDINTDNLTAKVDEKMQLIDTTINNLKEIVSIIDVDASMQGKLDEINNRINQLVESSTYTELKNDIEKLKTDTTLSKEEFDIFLAKVQTEIDNCKTAISDIKSNFDTNITPALDESMAKIQAALISTQGLLGNVSDSFDDIDKALTLYSTSIGTGSECIENLKEQVILMRDGITPIIDAINKLSENEDLATLVEMLNEDPESLAEFVSSPVKMENVEIYEIKTYGSAMAAFYTTLALWVGALILSALIHVKVKTDKEAALRDTKLVHHFFGRYALFFVIGQVQALITVLGNLLYIDIQCRHPFLFWLAAAVTSFAFTMLIYSLTVAMGNVGQALAVIILVIQVAGAGGTFPVEVLPKVYQALYKYLPFNYAMNSMRECVGGMYKSYYRNDILMLLIFVAISLFIGLVIAIPFRKVNNVIEESKEKSGIMI